MRETWYVEVHFGAGRTEHPTAEAAAEHIRWAVDEGGYDLAGIRVIVERVESQEFDAATWLPTTSKGSDHA